MSAQMGVGANYLELTGGSAGAAGTGAFTLAALVQPAVGNNNMGIATLLNTGTRQRTSFIDNLKVFTEGDFTGFNGGTAITLGQYYVIVVSKAAGAGQPVRFEVWPYASDGSGTMVTGTDTTNLGDGSVVNQIRFGQAIDSSNGLYSVLGIWTRQLSAAEAQTLKTNLLSVWAGLGPAELIHTKNWNGTTGLTVAVGTATFVGVTGVVGVGADPASFNFSLGVSLADPTGSGGSGSSGQLDGLALGDGSGGAGTAGTSDGRALGDGSGGAGTGGSSDTIAAAVIIADGSGGGGTGGSADTIVNGSPVVHDTMVMPILLNARTCLVTEVGKLQYPPSRVQIRPGATFEFQVDASVNECCEGIAWVRRGTITPTTGQWPNQLSESYVNPPGQYAVQLELGIMRCVPIAADQDGANVTEAQWLQAAQNAEDDAAALRRAICCLRDLYGVQAVIENPILPLENGGMCGGQVVTLLVRAPACDCVA